MGADKHEESKYRAKLRENSAREGVADWANADCKTLVEAIAIVSQRGGALRFGYTRDGGAYAIGVYGDGAPYTVYVRPEGDLDGKLGKICQLFSDR